MGTTGGSGGEIGVDSRQLLLVGICIFGLVAAAFLAPVVGANNLLQPGGSGAGSGGEGGAEPREPEPGDAAESRDREPVTVGEGDRDGVSIGRPVERDDDCLVRLENEPKPGANTTVRVTTGGVPAEDVRVWFNERYVGRTDDLGVVSGTVPFVTELSVTVESPTAEPCRFARRGDSRPALQSGVVGSGVGVAAGATGAGGERSRLSDSGVPVRQQGDAGSVNNSSEYEVASDVEIRLRGDPIPGSNVTLVATVEGTPMTNASVSVDGSQVGRTDENGRYRLRVPERDSVTVTVRRGEIAGNTTIDVFQLSVRFVPQLLVPGERATVHVTQGQKPVENATVTLGGERLGTTGPNGTVSLTLPVSLSGSVQTSVGSQTAAVPLWMAYVPTAGATLLLGVLTALTTGIAARMGGRGAARRVAFVWAGVWTLFVGYVVGEGLGLAVAAGAVLLVAIYRYRRAVASGGATTASLVAGFVEWCARAALWVVGALESFVDRARAGALRLAAWLRTLPTSLSGLATRLGAWLRTLPGRLADGVRSLPLRVLAAVAGAVAIVAVATYAFGVVGLLVSTGLVVLAALGWWLTQREPAVESATDAVDATEQSGQSTDDAAGSTLRQLWRRLASWVLPGTWQTRTPAEVSRAAVERGLPRGPVETLTEAFRDVEYGGQSEEGRQATARTAFDALEDARESETDGEEE